MWTLVLFDLPATDAATRKAYARFRSALLRWGFEALQKSAYCRWEESADAGDGLRRRVLSAAPREGLVAVLGVSDRTWAGMRLLVDGVPGATPPKPERFLVLE